MCPSLTYFVIMKTVTDRGKSCWFDFVLLESDVCALADLVVAFQRAA